MALLAATMSAKGTSTINNVEQIDRGYEELDKDCARSEPSRTRGVTSFATHLECSRCQEDFPVDQIQQVCKSDGGPLLVRYDLRRVRDSLTRDALRDRPETLWRYRELLPTRILPHAVSLGETTLRCSRRRRSARRSPSRGCA